jgi:hypothetical protein
VNHFLYILSYNPDATNFSAGQLQVHIETSRMIDSWYLPYRGTYLLQSDELLVTLNATFQKFFEHSPYAIVYVHEKMIGGSMPEIIWNWINNSGQQVLG